MAIFANMRRVVPEKLIRLFTALFTLVLISFAATGCSSTGGQVEAKQYPVQVAPELVRADFVATNFAERRTNLTRAVLMPPDLAVTRATFWRTKSLRTNDAIALSQELQELVAGQLQQLGFVIVPPGTGTNASAPELTEARARLKRWMGEAPWGSSIFTVDTNAEESVGLGSAAKVLADDANADVLVCIKMWGTQTTFGHRARTFHATAAGLVGAVVGAGAAGAALYYATKENGVDGADGLGLLLLIPAGAAGGFIVFREVGWWITGGGTYEEGYPNRTGIQVALVEGATGKVLWANTETAGIYGTDFAPLVARLFFNFPK